MSEEDDKLGLPKPGAPVQRTLQPVIMLTLEGQLPSRQEEQVFLARIPGDLAGLLCSAQHQSPPGQQFKSLFGSPAALEEKMKAATVHTEGPDMVVEVMLNFSKSDWESAADQVVLKISRIIQRGIGQVQIAGHAVKEIDVHSYPRALSWCCGTSRR